ncbi:unnamed protein product [Anisakis simplex]|uniref:ACB domain-containing protein n=1 Tax=Anisakis simplex TaxID=6269 RepID=A0A3P6QZ97_ANISI|nr:unnamed protein product [Anisakis simplex]
MLQVQKFSMASISGPFIATNDDKLLFYSLFKQATIGQVNVPKPSFFSVVERYKWNAWNELGRMPQDEAKEKYIFTLVEFLNKAAEQMNIFEWFSKSDNFDARKFQLIGFIQ